LEEREGPAARERRTGGDDAVCFTAGHKGSAYGAGVIHAYLAADRAPPRVAAGISTGALTAAAMQRAYKELEDPGPDERQRDRRQAEDRRERLETRRWRWFRRYLTDITRAPFDIFWKAVPDPLDFFSDRPPVRDLACPEALRSKEARARHAYFLLVLLGRWLARIPVTVRRLSRLAMAHVRYHEQYGGNAFSRAAIYRGLQLRLVSQLVLHFALHPMWVPEWKFWGDRRRLDRPVWEFLPRPLFGWRAWLVGVLLGAVAVVVSGSALLLLLWGALRLLSWIPAFSEVLGSNLARASIRIWSLWAGLVVLSALLLAGALVAGARLWRMARDTVTWLHGGERPASQTPSLSGKGRLTRYLMGKLEISRGLLDDYHLHRRLVDLFGEEGSTEPRVETSPMRVVLVASPLQKVESLGGQQLWAKRGASLITALRAALTLPVLMPPVPLRGSEETHFWWSTGHHPKGRPPLEELDLVDGSVVRKNPIPAFFAYIKQDKHRQIARALCSESPGNARVHVVYNVPIEPLESPRASEQVDVVDSALLSLSLASRRDTRMEVRQTNVMSRLQVEIDRARRRARDGGGATEPAAGSRQDGGPRMLPIFADEIAPEREIRFANALDPTREELLKVAADGCRRTLETLFPSELRTLSYQGAPVPCRSLLSRVAPRRSRHLAGDTPGVAEVCRACPRRLRARELRRAAPGVRPTFGAHGGDGRGYQGLEKRFPHLAGEEPRIVFVASGGVFRGATHIGVLGALKAMKIKPDLVLGASVGTLMGGACAAISRLPDDQAFPLLARLADTFLRVDETVALTRTLKNAAKQLGLRGSSVRLSPRQLRRHILRGSRSDPGFAVVGAPPVLIDGISHLFLLPHRRTTEIAAEFVAGHFTRATAAFFDELKEETLRRLEIRYALMGTDLLEPRARALMGDDNPLLRLDRCQPYHHLHGGWQRKDHHRWVSLFGTTTFLNHRSSFLLGRDFLTPAPDYDFVQAGLCSSAFPAVFSPRSEAEVLPGVGRTDVLFADGGMFDNLPFFPAMKVLSRIQQDHRRASGRSSLELLRIRSEQPDLCLAAGLEAPPKDLPPGPDGGSELESLKGISDQAKSLKNNLKIASFDGASRAVGRQIDRLLRLHDRLRGSAPESVGSFEDPEFVDGLVSAAVLGIEPRDEDHINPTFAFCASLQLDPERVRRAVAHGCFQTHARLVEVQPTEARSQRRPADLEDPLERSLKALQQRGRVPRVEERKPQLPEKEDGTCPYFTRSARNLPGDLKDGGFRCPFVRAAETGWERGELDPARYRAVRGVYSTCCSDRLHRR
jgi:predicted acylesterase/phospholipase RssA